MHFGPVKKIKVYDVTFNGVRTIQGASTRDEAVTLGNKIKNGEPTYWGKRNPKLAPVFQGKDFEIVEREVEAMDCFL